MNLKKIGKVLKSKSVGTGPSSYEKKNLPGRGLTKVEKHWFKLRVEGRELYVHKQFPRPSCVSVTFFRSG